MDYKSKDVIGKSWVRFPTVILSNKLKQVPSIEITEENAVKIDEDTTITSPCRTPKLVDKMTNPSETFNLLDNDGNIVGTMTYLQYFMASASLCFHVAAKRDLAAQQTPEPTPEA